MRKPCWSVSFKVILPDAVDTLPADLFAAGASPAGGFIRTQASRGSVTSMTPSRYRRPLMVLAAVIAVLSLIAVGTVMALAFAGSVAPTWVTYSALYGLPAAFILMLLLVLDGVAGRRRAGKAQRR